MTTMLVPAEKTARTHGRGRLLALLECEVLLSRLVVGGNGGFIAETQDWDGYWEPLRALNLPKVARGLEALHEAWCDYIRARFDNGLQRDFCFKYFALLDSVVEECEAVPSSKSRRQSLQQVLAFECFPIVAAGSGDGPVAAGTTTLRNPCYLLTKLKTPDALDDPQFLPLITVAQAHPHLLFYHYRQHKLSVDSGNSLLLYLCAAQSARQKSFHVVNALEQQISQGTDPRANSRASRMADKIVIPYLQKALSTGPPASNGPADLELVDLGSGSGIVAARICQRIGQTLASQGTKARFRVWFVDLSLSDPKRFFEGKQLREATDCLTAIGGDYRHWLAAPDRLPPPEGVRIGLASRFFNNLSDFSAVPVSRKRIAEARGVAPSDNWWEECLPSRCLHPNGKGPGALDASNSRIWLGSGRTFAQASLSQYFRGLHVLSGLVDERAPQPGDGGNLYVPLRRFRSECLLTIDDQSVLERFLDSCSLVVVEDADLRPQDLVEHRGRFRSEDIVAIDMTRPLGLKGHHSYALVRARDGALEALVGRRLW